jgi:hypothetical protein
LQPDGERTPLKRSRRYDEVHWGIHGCDAPGCWRPADLIWNEQDIYCLIHADDLLERWEVAAGSSLEFMSQLRPFGE